LDYVDFICEQELDLRDLAKQRNTSGGRTRTSKATNKNTSNNAENVKEKQDHFSIKESKESRSLGQISPLVFPDNMQSPGKPQKLTLLSDNGTLKIRHVPTRSSHDSISKHGRDSNPFHNLGEGYASTEKLDEDVSKYETPTNFERDKEFNFVSIYKGNYIGPRVPINYFHHYCKPTQIDQAAKLEELSISSKLSSKKSPGILKSKLSPDLKSGLILATTTQAHLPKFVDRPNEPISSMENESNTYDRPQPLLPLRTFSTLAAYYSSKSNSKNLNPTKAPSTGTLMEVETTINYHRLLVSKELDRPTLHSLVQGLSQYIDNLSSEHGFRRLIHQREFEDNGDSIGIRRNLDKMRYEHLNDDNSVSSQKSNTSAQVIPNHSDPFRTNVELNQSSTLLRTVRKDRKFNQKINRLRLTIEKKKDNLNFVLYLRLLFCLVLILIFSLCVIKYFHDKSSNTTMKNMLSLNLLCNALRPSVFHYKESVRRDVLLQFNPSPANYYGKSYMNWYGFALGLGAMTQNFITVPLVMNRSRLNWDSQEQGGVSLDPHPKGEFSLMVYVAYYMSTIAQLRKIPYKDSSVSTPLANRLYPSLKFFSRNVYVAILKVYEEGIADTQLEFNNIRLNLYLGLAVSFCLLGCISRIGIT
jgi:hypothetical protein